MAKFTPKEQRFIEEYLVDLNATQAAIRAGYSKNAAGNIGCENLMKPHIAAAIVEEKKKRSERTRITQDMVLEEYAKIGFANIDDYMSWNHSGNELKDSNDLTREQKAAVSEVVYKFSSEGGEVKVKLHDKKGALDSMMRHLGGFNDKLEITETPRSRLIDRIKARHESDSR